MAVATTMARKEFKELMKEIVESFQIEVWGWDFDNDAEAAYNNTQRFHEAVKEILGRYLKAMDYIDELNRALVDSCVAHKDYEPNKEFETLFDDDEEKNSRPSLTR